MSKKLKHDHSKPASQVKTRKVEQNPGDTFSRVENWLAKRSTLILWILLAITTLYSALLLNYKITDGGDDAGYIERAWDFLKDSKYPYFQGPAYPLSLAVLLHFFGLNILALKAFSVLCQLVFVLITYITFKNRIPFLVLFALLSYVALNNFFLFYAAQTYTEAFFLMVQACCFLLFFKILDRINSVQNIPLPTMNELFIWLLFGLMFTLLSISKSIALVGVFAVFMFLIIERKYKAFFYALLAFIAIRLAYEFAVISIFGPNETNQLEMMLRIDMYDAKQGHEDLWGMLARFFKNCSTYFSIHFLRMINFRKFDYLSTDTIPLLAFLIPLTTIELTRRAFKDNKIVFFSGLYACIVCVGVFFGVQAKNMQDRLILIAMPMLFLLFFYGAYLLVKKYSFGQKLFLVFSLLMLSVTFIKSSINVKQNYSTLKANVEGDKYYGFTPDWKNYLLLSNYCADSLAPGSNVLCRKPSISFLYSNGKKFIGEFSSPAELPPADTILNQWHSKKINYIILASIRSNPKFNSGFVVNNIHRLARPIFEKYPEKLRLIKAFGEDEPASLFELK